MSLDFISIMHGKRFAQNPPPAPVPPNPMGAMGAPPTGMPPVMPGQPPAPTAPMADEAQQEHLPGPLDGVAKVLFDADIIQLVESSADKTPEELAMQIWTDYGGNPDGSTNKEHVGTRTLKDNKLSPEEAEEAYDNSAHVKWIRLPQGKTIGDISTIDQLTNTIRGVISGTTKNMAKQNAPAEGGGGMPGLASSKIISLRLASLLDKEKAYKESDLLYNKNIR